ncbi:MAG: tetratricopeptide repeat protein [Bacteroidota bacterium]
MLKLKNGTVFLSVLSIIIFSQSCTDSANKRYISDTDTTYSPDIRSVSKKINASPDNAELYYNRANAFYFENNFKQALGDIDYAIELDSSNALYEYFRAKTLISGDTANSKEAIKSFQKSIRIKPNYVESMLDYGKLLIARQSYEEAEKIYFEANQADPSNPVPYFYLGIMAKEMKDTQKAMALFEKTLVYDGNYYDAIMQLANFYAESMNDKALPLFDRATKINPYFDEPIYAKALFLQKKNLYKDAAALYEQVAKMNPGHILCRYNLAYINVFFENYDIAKNLLTEVITMAPENADAYALRGLVYEKQKNNSSAMIDYQQALQYDKDQKSAREGLKRIKISISF